MNSTTIYQVTVLPLADGAETFNGTFLEPPTIEDVREAISQQPMLVLHVDTLTTILHSAGTMPQVAGGHDTAGVNVRAAGVTIGTIRVSALPAYNRGPRPAIIDRELAELVA